MAARLVVAAAALAALAAWTACGAALNATTSLSSPVGRVWATEPHDAALHTTRCTLARHHGPISDDAFLERFAATGTPVVLTDLTNNTRFAAMCQKHALLDEYGDQTVVVSTANTFSYDKVRMPLRTYIAHHMGPSAPYANAADVLYHFGDNDFMGDAWPSFYEAYVRPPLVDAGVIGSLSFGMGGSGSGVPFHTHGPVFAEVLHGRKRIGAQRWFLYPPEAVPAFSPIATSYAWMLDVYPTLAEANRPDECELGPGEVLYLPHGWWHATLNLGQSVFISVFV